MGKLINRDSLGIDASWYFPDAWYDSTGRKTNYEWPNPAFPCMVAIHHDQLISAKLKCEIRRWVENNITDTVIFDCLDLSYRVYYGTDYSWDRSYEESNFWYRFHFEDEHSAAAFRLTFFDSIKEITKYNPRYPGHKEWCEMTPEERYEKTRYR